MATHQRTIDYLLEQLSGNHQVTARKMFGEFGLYRGGIFFGMVCDDQLFIKPTPSGRAYLGAPMEGVPYPGAKAHFLIAGDRWEEGDWLTELIRVTAAALPAPKAKPPNSGAKNARSK